jgi:hypothetical protein
MTRAFTEQIGALIAEHLPEFEFQSRCHRLYRGTETGWQAIALEVLPSATPGMGKIAAYAQVRHDVLEALYTPHHPYLKPKEFKAHPTLTINCDALVKREELVHAFKLDSAIVKDLSDAYAASIKVDVIPWLDRFSNEQALFEGLAGSDPKTWATSDRLTRFPVLMAILAKRGDAVGFDRVGSEFQEWCKNKHALVYASLAAAMLKMRPSERLGGGGYSGV